MPNYNAVDHSILSVVNHADLPSLEVEAGKIIASKPFNRLNGLYQFSINYTDNRLTNRYGHSFYVAETGREICHRLGLSFASGQLAYNIGLIHDIGHPPFSHWGETSIKEHLGQDQLLWNHDTAGLNCVTVWAPEIMISSHTLEGLAKRYWRYDERAGLSATNHSRDELPHETMSRASQLYLDGFNHLEGQIAAQADRIGFNATDIQDGLMIGRLTPEMLQAHFPSAFHVYEKLLNELIAEYKKTNGLEESDQRIRSTIVHTPAIHAIVFARFSDAFREFQISDLVTQTQRLIDSRKITTPEDVRAQQQLTADFSEELKKDFYNFSIFCRDVIFAKSTKPFKTFVDAAFDHFLKNKVGMLEPYNKRFHDAASHTDKILVIAEYMTRELSDQDIVMQVIQNSPEIYREHFPGYEIVEQEQVSVSLAEHYLHAALEKKTYDLAQAAQTDDYFAVQTNHVVALPVEANIVIIGAARKEIDTVLTLVKRYKITDKKLVINIVAPLSPKDDDYLNLLRSIEQQSLPIEINYIQNSVFSIIETPGHSSVVLSNLMTLTCDHVIFEEQYPAQKALTIIQDIHKKKNPPGKMFTRPLPEEEAAYAKEYIETNHTTDPRFPNTNQVLPTWVQYGALVSSDGDEIYMAERLTLHETIIQKALLWNPVTKIDSEKTPDPDNSPTFHVISGGMSVGMTYMQRLMIYEKVINPEHSVIITPMSFLDMPEFKARFHYQHPEKSPLLVEEYYTIARKIAEAAMARGLNVVFVDQADDRDAILAMLNDAKKHHYASSIVGLTMSPEAYYAASQLWLTKFNRIPDHSRGFGDLREFAENWPYYSKMFDVATLVETYFHVNDIDKSEDDLTRKEYEVEVLFSSHYNKKGHRVEKVSSTERYAMFLDRAQYIQPTANSLDSANKSYPYPQFARQLDTAKRGNPPVKSTSEFAVVTPVVSMKHVRRFFKNELELKFKEMVRKTTEQRSLVRKVQLDSAKIQLIKEIIGGARDSMDLKSRLIPFEETKHKIISSLMTHQTPSGEKGALIVIGGGPSSGKSTYLKRIEESYKREQKDVVFISTSDLKWLIPEYGFLATLYKENDPSRKLALDNNITEQELFYIGSTLYGLFEKEKIALITACINELMKMGLTVIVEDHLDNKEFTTEMFNASRRNNAYTILIAPDISVDNFFIRGRALEQATGKWLMPVYSLDHHKKFEENWQDYLTLTDIACKVDNNGLQGTDSLSAIAINGDLYVVQKEKYLAARAKRGLEITRQTENDDKTFSALDVRITSDDHSEQDIQETDYPAEALKSNFPPHIVQLVENAVNREEHGHCITPSITPDQT